MIVQDMFRKFIKVGCLFFVLLCSAFMICIFSHHHDLTMIFIFQIGQFPGNVSSCFNTLFQTEVYWRILKVKSHSITWNFGYLFQILHHFCWIYTWTLFLDVKVNIPDFYLICGKALVFSVLKIHRSLIWYKVSILLRKKHLIVCVFNIYLVLIQKVLSGLYQVNTCLMI